MTKKTFLIILGIIIILIVVFLAVDRPSEELLVEEPVRSTECLITGCNNEICSEEEVITVCIYLPEFACYQDATCEVQEDGECGWTETEELIECLESF